MWDYKRTVKQFQVVLDRKRQFRRITWAIGVFLMLLFIGQVVSSTNPVWISISAALGVIGVVITLIAQAAADRQTRDDQGVL